MGIIADAVCCIDSEDIIEKSKLSDSLLNTSNVKRPLGLSTSKTFQVQKFDFNHQILFNM